MATLSAWPAWTPPGTRVRPCCQWWGGKRFCLKIMHKNEGFAVACGLLVISLFTPVFVDEGNPILLLLVPGFLLGWLILFLIAVFRVFNRDYLSWKKRLIPFYLLITPLALIAVGSICTSIINRERDWLTVESYDFTGSDIILFRKDGEYQHRRGSPLGSSGPSFGRYERRDSLLILRPNSGKNRLPTVRIAGLSRLVIRPYGEFEKHRNNSSVRLIALDSAGNSLAVFRIIERN
ncbi:hypothetical protein HNP98_000402 [Hymenobacter sp. 9A]|uniref:Uncharacterized protein n=1 Tax=Hymenobacter caeli TaxID=2735894 RepID=A0ABX2FKE7_9BACT|nr:hypothetical protein [Hymenobacter caeli]